MKINTRANRVARTTCCPGARSAQEVAAGVRTLSATPSPRSQTEKDLSKVRNTEKVRHPERRRAADFLLPQRLTEPESRDLWDSSGGGVIWRACRRERPAGGALRGDAFFALRPVPVKGARSFDSLGQTPSVEWKLFASLAQDDGTFFYFAGASEGMPGAER